MTGLSTAEETTFGDLNGPLNYWGPAASDPRLAAFSQAEQALLLRLRRQFESSSRQDLVEICDALLDSAASVVLSQVPA